MKWSCVLTASLTSEWRLFNTKAFVSQTLFDLINSLVLAQMCNLCYDRPGSAADHKRSLSLTDAVCCSLSGGSGLLAGCEDHWCGVWRRPAAAPLPDGVQHRQRLLLHRPGAAVRHHLLQDIQGHPAGHPEVWWGTPVQVSLSQNQLWPQWPAVWGRCIQTVNMFSTSASVITTVTSVLNV